MTANKQSDVRPRNWQRSCELRQLTDSLNTCLHGLVLGHLEPLQSHLLEKLTLDGSWQASLSIGDELLYKLP